MDVTEHCTLHLATSSVVYAITLPYDQVQENLCTRSYAQFLAFRKFILIAKIPKEQYCTFGEGGVNESSLDSCIFTEGTCFKHCLGSGVHFPFFRAT